MDRKTSCIPWLIQKIRHRIPALLGMFLFNVLGAFLGVRFALSTQRVIDSAVSRDSHSLWQACLLMGGLILACMACNVLTLHLDERLAADLDRDFKQSIMHHLLCSNYAEVSKYHSGDLVSRLNNDVRQVCTGILAVLSTGASMASGLAAAIAVLLTMEPLFTLILVAASALLALATLLVQRRMKTLHKRASAAGSQVSSFFQEVLEKLLMVQALNVEQEVERRSNALLEHQWQVLRKRKNVNITMNVGSSALSYLGTFAALAWCAARLFRGEMTFGTLTAITQLAGQLQIPMLTLPTMIPKFISIFSASERLMEMEEIPAQEPERESVRNLYPTVQAIRAHNLTFTYGRDPVFCQAEFTIPVGGLTVITGPSGVGKSTLLKLLLGVYHPNGGILCLETREGDLPIGRAARGLFSYAPQGNLLLSGTLRDNLLLVRPDAGEEELNRAVHVSAMDEYLEQLPQGLDTVLGENAGGLSEGQAQRLALARAVLSDAPILLLDEVTSALDANTERLVLGRIRALADRTCIVVTHRPAILELADWQLSVTADGVSVQALSHMETSLCWKKGDRSN